MSRTRVKMDLGQGDMVDIVIEQEEDFILSDFLNDIEKSSMWVVLTNTAIQKSHIKRVVIERLVV